MPWNLNPNDSVILAVHAALLPNGKILYFGGDQHSAAELAAGRIQNTRLFVSDGTIEPGSTTLPSTDVFCSGHSFAADGRLIVAGGTEEWGTGMGGDPNHPHGLNFGGERACWVYLPRANEWQRIADMHFEAGRPTGGGRWYPTLVTLGNGEVCAFSGHPSRRTPPGTPPQTPPGDQRHNNNTPERYSPGGNFWTLLSGSVETAAAAGDGFYPRVHLLRDGRLFLVTQVNGRNRFYNAFDGTLSGPEITPTNVGGYDGWDYASVLLPLLPAEDYRPQILIAGGPDALRIDLGDLTTTPAWGVAGGRPAVTLNRPRRFACGVMLPTGQVLITGGVFQVGTSPPDPVTPELAIMEGELYTPAIDWTTGRFTSSGESWTATEPATVIRSYHSTALLMPDGRVWTAGSSKKAQNGNPNDVNIAEKRIEIYSPPYVGQPRPTITAQPAFVIYGQTFSIDFTLAPGTTIQRAALLRCGSITHAFDADQRYVGLNIVPAGANRLTATAPPNGNVAPPGNYMLWLIDSAGRPCALAPILRLGAMRAFFLSDHSSFSVHEVNAGGLPAMFSTALYFVVEGCLPHEIASLGGSPAFSVTFDSPVGPPVASIQAVPNGGPQWELPTQPPDVPQRATFACDIRFNDASAFATADFRSAWVTGTWGPFRAEAELRLTSQPNPYMRDGPIEWLSTDVRVFQVRPTQMPHGVLLGFGDTPFEFLQRQLTHFNAPGNTDFNGIPDQQDQSPLELSQTVPLFPFFDVPVFNFAIARVRYVAQSATAPNVRVFFRMFNTVGTALEFDTATTYARHVSAGGAVPLLGRQGSTLISIPFFSEPRVTPSVTMQSQSDGLNVHTLTPNGANEFIWHYGAFLDINQPAVQFPRVSTSDGPFDPAQCESIQTLVADQHQCVVAEIFFVPPDPAAPAIIQPRDTPGSSDKLGQRNIAIVRSANPGAPATRTIAHTFEVKPSSGATAFVPFPTLAYGLPNSLVFAVDPRRNRGPDELIFTWNDLPRESVVTIYLPSIEAADILRILATRPGPAAIEILDAHTIRVIVGDVSYVPLPGGRAENIAGLLSIELPAGVKHGQLFTVHVQQCSGFTRRIIGAFQLNIPVRHEAELLPLEIKRLSLLRWIFEHMPSNDRWYPVYLRYLGHIGDRVREFGGDPDEVAPSPHGTGRPVSEDEKCNCPERWLISGLLAPTIVLLGVLPTNAALVVAAIVIVLMVAIVCRWRMRCAVTACDVLAALLLGVGVGGAVLGTAAVAGLKIVPGVLALSAIAAGALVVGSLLSGCWGKCWCFLRRWPSARIAMRKLPRLNTPELPANLQFRQEPRPAKRPTFGIDQRDVTMPAVRDERHHH